MNSLVRNGIVAAACTAFASSAALSAPPPEWLAKVRQMLAAKQDYPRAAQMRGDEGTAKLRLAVAADGSISNVELIQATGSSVLDREAVSVVREVGNLPAPPGGAATVVVPLIWKMM